MANVDRSSKFFHKL